MHKGDIVEGTIEKVRFPNKGVFTQQGYEITVKNTLPGQQIRARISKRRSGRAEANLLEVLAPSVKELPAACPNFGSCGGCSYLSLPEEEERAIKEEQVRCLLREADPSTDEWFEGILKSPLTQEYRNKMELTFGDEEKGGPMTLGMHRRGSLYDITDAGECRLVDEDYRRIIRAARDYWAASGLPFYHRMRREGYLRHLLIRKGMKTGEILVDLVTTGQVSSPAEESQQLEGFAAVLLSLELSGRICGILHTRNDSVADVVEDQGTDILYGKASFEEELLGLRFTVTPFSFFQTSSAGAELLYETARRFIAQAGAAGGVPDLAETGAAGGVPAPTAHGTQPGARQSETARRRPVIFDLYCGTGTISLLMAPAASRVVGVELVEEAVMAARENAVRNGIDNCTFLAGDVLTVLDEIEEKPDLIILDPPRDGVHPKALPKILRYGVPFILYISCKPTSLARDLPQMRAYGYVPVRGVSVNSFARTTAIETVCLLGKQKLGDE